MESGALEWSSGAVFGRDLQQGKRGGDSAHATATLVLEDTPRRAFGPSTASRPRSVEREKWLSAVPRKSLALVGMFVAGVFLLALGACPRVGLVSSLVCGFAGMAIMFVSAAPVVGLATVRAIVRELLPLWRALVALSRRWWRE